MFFKHQKKNKPFFTIITVVKNDQDNITKTINSIESQKFRDYEYIIVDGFSEDKTTEKILKKKRKINIIVREKDKGLYDAMNKGVKLSSGEVIVFVNSGDILTKKALEIIHKKFKKNKVDFVFGTVKRHYTKKTILKHGFNPKRILYNFDFATAHSTGFFIKKKSLSKIGKFNLKYKCSADYDLYYKAIVKLNMVGDQTTKKQLIGEVSAGGFSSKLSFYQHLIEETSIRLDNNQNIFFLSIIFINSIIKNFLKKLY